MATYWLLTTIFLGAPLCAEELTNSAKNADKSVSLSPPGTVLGARLSYVWLRHARSLAFSHLAKPALQVQVLSSAGDNWAWGGAVGGVITPEKNYRIWYAQLRGRYYRRWRTMQWGIAAGLGVSPNAAILHSDLRSNGGLVALGALAVDAQWQWAENAWWGVQLETEQLATLHLGLLLRVGL